MRESLQPNPRIKILGNMGALSTGLRRYFPQDTLSKILISKEQSCNRNFFTFHVATYCPTLRANSKSAFNKEIDYFTTLFSSLGPDDFLVYVSSQTLELTDSTYYSKAKYLVENMLRATSLNYAILRLGMIYDNDNNRYNLKVMNQSSKSFFTFRGDIPKTTVCTIRDIAELIYDISCNPSSFCHKTLNLGVVRLTFLQLQNISSKKFFRLPLLSFSILSLISIFSPRIAAYTKGRALSSSPVMAFKSSFD